MARKSDRVVELEQELQVHVYMYMYVHSKGERGDVWGYDTE